MRPRSPAGIAIISPVRNAAPHEAPCSPPRARANLLLHPESGEPNRRPPARAHRERGLTASPIRESRALRKLLTFVVLAIGKLGVAVVSLDFEKCSQAFGRRNPLLRNLSDVLMAYACDAASPKG